jgi:hypothetical protein
VRDSATPGPYGGQLGIPYVASSADGGRTWSTPVLVADKKTTNAQSPQVLTGTKSGALVDVWANYRRMRLSRPEGVSAGGRPCRR